VVRIALSLSHLKATIGIDTRRSLCWYPRRGERNTALFHQDPRYYYQGSGSLKSRLMHAVSSPFVTRSDSGRNVPNSSYLLGDICSAALSNLYYPKANRGAKLVFTNAAIGLAGRVGTNSVREFLSKLLTRSVPRNGNL
jgi:hypothetical protein